jgi:WD40 repeat protein
VSAADTNFYVTGGTLRHDAPSYVERQADRDLSEGLLAGEFSYVLTPRQMGKSSLMVRTASKLREQGVNVIALDLTAIGQNLSAEQWYDGLIARMGRQLKLDEELERFWREHERLGPCQRLFMAIRDVVLGLRPGPLAIFVDEIDSVRSLPFSTDEFFAAMRECHNRRAEDPELNRVTFCLLGVATPSDLVRDTRTTPFNIGRRIELHDFNEAEAAPLAQGLKRRPTGKEETQTPRTVAEAEAAAHHAERLLKRILFWTGGHPYLTQRFCHAVAGNARATDLAEVDRLCDELFLSSRARERDDNLLFVRDRLLRSEADRQGLLELYGKVRRDQRVLDDEASLLASVLRLSGIVKTEGGRLRRRNRIYDAVFDEDWIQAHLPDAELRRQKTAFRRGVVRTTAIAAVVVAALTIAVVIAIGQARNAGLALAASHFSQAKALRVSGLAGQRYESLIALEKARGYHTNMAALRDEVLASLALVDLRETTNGADRFDGTRLVELDPDLEILAVAEADGAITLRAARGGQLLRTLPGDDLSVEWLRFSVSASVLVAQYRGAARSRLVVWDWKKGQELFAAAHGISGNAIDFSADGRYLAVGRPDGRVLILSLPGREILHTLELKLDSGAARVPQSVRFNPPGDRLAIGSLDDQYVEIWNPVVTQRVARAYHTGLVRDIAWHPRGQLLASACEDSRVYLWLTNDFDKPKKLAGHEGSVAAVAFNHQGTLLASLGKDETVRLWIPATERQMAGGRAGEVFDRLQFSGDDRHLMAAGGGRTKIRVWEALGGELKALPVQGSRGGSLRTIDFSPDSRWLLAVSAKHLSIWDSDSGRDLGAIPVANARAACFTADSRHLIASTDEGLTRRPLPHVQGLGGTRIPGVEQWLRWSAKAGEASAACLEWAENNGGQRQEVLNELGMMAVTQDRKTAAVVRKKDLLLLPLEPEPSSGARTNHMGVHLSRLALHPFAGWLATWTGETNALQLWNLSAGLGASAPSVVPGSEYFAFSPDGKWLATHWAGAFQFYRVGDWKEPAFSFPRMAASGQHAPATFSWDGRTVALASSRYSIQLIKLPESGRGKPELIATLESPDRLPLEMLAFSPDGRKLAAATDGQIVQLWNLALLRVGLAALDLHRGWPNPP